MDSDETQQREMGKFFGYPKCCIDSFVKNQANRDSNQEKLFYLGTGFIPCSVCAAKIATNELSIESLIKNRKCPTAFPEDDISYTVKITGGRPFTVEDMSRILGIVKRNKNL